MNPADILRQQWRRDKTQRMVVRYLPWLTCALFALLGSYGAFSGGLWGGAGITFAVISYGITAGLEGRLLIPSRDFIVLAIFALLITAALNLHSSYAAQSWYDWVRLVTIFLPLSLLATREILIYTRHRNLFTWMVLAGFAGAFALGVELFFSAPVLHIADGDHAALTRYNRGLSYLIVLAFPMLAALWHRPLVGEIDTRQLRLNVDHRDAAHSLRQRFADWRRNVPRARWVPFVLFILVMLFPTSLSESRAAKLAFILGLIAMAAARLAPRLTRHGLNLFTVLLIGWPLYAQLAFLKFHDKLGHIPPSWRARVEIWDYMSYRVFERPWLGWGLGTSKYLDFRTPHGQLYALTQDAAPHPHNAITQLWVELGAPGLALGLTFAWLTLRHASRMDRGMAPFAVGAWVAALVLALVAYNFWTDSMFAAFALTGFACALLQRDIRLRSGL